MLSIERQGLILEAIAATGKVSISELVAKLDVSDMTVRRDLDELESKGLLRRVHGGAVDSRGRSYEPPLLTRGAANLKQKELIGKVAAGMVANGDSIALDVGTTTREVARGLTGTSNLTVITPSFDIGTILADQPGIRLILTGGILRPGEHSLVGNLAEEAFTHFRVDKLFVGIGGIDFVAGLTEFNVDDAQVKKAMLRSAKEIILVADASKFGRIAFAHVAQLSVLDRIVTDAALPLQLQEQFKEQNIEVVLAG